MRVFLRRLCDEQGKTILLSSHILSEIAQLADAAARDRASVRHRGKRRRRGRP